MSIEFTEIKREVGWRERRVLGKGTLGCVWQIRGLRCQGRPNDFFALKLYKQDPEDTVHPAAFRELLDLRENLNKNECHILDSHFAWPRYLVTEQDQTIGIIMNLVPDKYYWTSETTGEKHQRNIGHIMFPKNDRERRELDLRKKLRLLSSIASGLEFLHRNNFIFGDISTNNILCSDDDEALFVDCDSVRKRGSMPVAGLQGHTPNFIPPEARPYTKNDPAYFIQTFQTDVYKFALIFLRVIVNSEQQVTDRKGNVKKIPVSENTDPSVAKNLIEPQLFNLLKKSLDADPNNRPSMQDWVKAFNRKQSGHARLSHSARPKRPSNSSVSENRIGEFVQVAEGVWERRPS